MASTIKTQLIKLGQYNVWANTKVCKEFLAKVDESLLDKEIPSSFSSIRKTIYHIWDAEVIWLDRLIGGSTTVLPISHEPMGIKDFSEKICSHSLKIASFLENQTDLYFEGSISYKNTSGKEFSTPISDVILHCMNHSTYHRGQLVTMLRGIGATHVSSTDYITWLRLNG